MSQSTTTRVQVTVEVIDLQPWNAETPAGKIYERAKEHALQQVDSAIRGGEIKFDRSGSMRIVGEPRVSLVMTEDK
jgi:hypothetical protein